MAEARFLYAEGKPFLLDPPQMVLGDLREPLQRLCRVYHRGIESIVRASFRDEAVRAMLSTPDSLSTDLEADQAPANTRVHICRLDLVLEPDGCYRVLETNANCPGGFVFSGICNRACRELIEGTGHHMPPALAHEEIGFMAKWFLGVMEAETGSRPEFLALIREEGGNRSELGDFGKHVRWEGLECLEVDPREVRFRCGRATVGDRPLTHAYQKLGMQRFLELRSELGEYVEAVRERALFVQNGQRGRWVGDDKLCLAIMSDPDFEYVFDRADIALLRKHIPWSRNTRRLQPDLLAEVRGRKDNYVVNRGLDTRGRGVIVGRGVTEDGWRDAVDLAAAEGWLVQEFHETSWIERDFGSPERSRHDLALGCIDGELTTLFTRSSGELRVNMARTGRMHPVFLGA